jgi:pyruvate dehydrogenase E2 component (dihydrolipoamide acetyltransferase)
MKVEMTIPDLSTTGTTIKVTNWLVDIGQPVKRGQPILEVETDKATMEVEAYITGILSSILAEPGDEVEVGQVFALIETQDELKVPKPAADPLPQAVAQVPGPEGTQKSVNPNESKSTGMFARNRQKAAQGAGEVQTPESMGSEQAVPPTPTLPMRTAQRVVAQRMLESKQMIPHFYLQSSANAEPMATRRNSAAGEKPVWDAFFVHAAGKALQRYDRLRASFLDGKLIPQQVEAVSVAVDLDGDLYLISITSPASKSSEQISEEIRAGVQRLQKDDPEAKLIHPSNLTITNLGATGVETFTAIINPPEAAILAIGKVSPVVVAVDGQITIQQRVSLTLSVDHRVVNGRYAANFLQAVVTELESF